MKIVLVGDDFPATQALRELLTSRKVRVSALFSSPYQRAGTLLTVSRLAGVPWFSSNELRGSQGLARLQEIAPDWLISVNAPLVLPEAVLRVPRSGALNVHPGPLPEYGGLHPHQWAIRNGETHFGVTVHFMEPQVAAGDIVLERRFPIAPDVTAVSLFRRCVQEGTFALQDVLQMIHSGEPLPRQPQDPTRRRCYLHRDAVDGRIDWQASADAVERFVRAGQYTMLAAATYTPHLDVPSSARDPLVEVLKVVVMPLDRPARAGMVMESRPGEPPIVSCGDGKGVQLVRTRLAGDPHVLPAPALRKLIPTGTMLQGRRGPRSAAPAVAWEPDTRYSHPGIQPAHLAVPAR